MSNLLHVIWLSLSCTPGTESFAKLLGRFSSAEEIYAADSAEIARCIGSKSKDYNALIDKSTDDAERILDFCMSKNVGLLSYFDDSFPISLRKIKNPPVLLYYRGKLPDFNGSFLASIVGARKLSSYGKKHSFKIANDLARSGAVIVSGMATGIDGVALAGALAASMPTVAILGSGIDVCYPIQHRRLAREIVKRGCVMTEYAPGTRPEKYNFPVRNRIISALSEITLVIEGNERSGALITARKAFEQGKTVYAFPGNVGNVNSQASMLLLKNGAKVFTSADDIVRDFENQVPARLNPFKLAENERVDMYEVLRALEVSCVAIDDEVFNSKTKRVAKNQVQKKVTVCESSDERTDRNEEKMASFDKRTVDLYKKIPMDSDCSVEELIDENYSLREVMATLLRLEIARFVTMLPGDRVKRNF